MNKIELLTEIVKKQDEYIKYLSKAVKTECLLRDITIGPRKRYEKQLSDLKKQLEECDKGNNFNGYKEYGGSGWICPRCFKVHSWLSMECDCPPKTITWNTDNTESINK